MEIMSGDHVDNNPDTGNEELKVEQTVVRRRRTDRKRASVKTKLWRQSMMERSVLPPPPPPPDSCPHPLLPDSSPSTTPRDNNTAETKTSNMSDYTESSHDNQGDGVVSHSISDNISSRDTSISSIDNKISLPENTELSTETPGLSDTRNKTSPASHLVNNLPSSDENKWMSSKRLSIMRRQCLPPPPVPPSTTL